MKKYIVDIEETRYSTLIIEAENMSEAYSSALKTLEKADSLDDVLGIIEEPETEVSFNVRPFEEDDET